MTCQADENSQRSSTCFSNNGTSEAFKTNLKTLLNSLEQKAPLNNGFYNSTFGESSDKVYGLVRCRGDLLAEDCASCLRISVTHGLENCKDSIAQAIHNKWCFVHYSNNDFFGQWKGPKYVLYNNLNDSSTVNEKGRNLMAELAAGASTDPLMFKASFVDVGDAGKRYGQAQCNRDLNKTNCVECLKNTFDGLFTNSLTFSDAQNLGCGMWYDKANIYYNSSIPTPPPPGSSAGPQLKTPPSAWLVKLGTQLIVLLLLISGSTM